MSNILKVGCLAIYGLAIAGFFISLPFGIETPLRCLAIILLGVHLVEALVMFRHVRRYPGSLVASLVLTLLFGFLHWWPLRSDKSSTFRRAGQSSREMNMFENKVVVITGAGSGIGRALAVQFAEAGARLALSDIDDLALAETLKQLPSGADARTYIVNVAVRSEVFAHADAIKRDFGTAHYIINNAGATVVGTVANTDIEEYEWQLNINLYGVLYGTKAFLPMLLQQSEGCIVNISSIFGLLSYPCQSAYNMSKFAVRGLTECLWQELRGTGVRAVCVHPGGIRTNIERAGRRVKSAGKMEDLFATKVKKMLVTPPDKCAADIIRGLRKGKERILTGYLSRTTYWMVRLLPNSYPAILRRLG